MNRSAWCAQTGRLALATLAKSPRVAAALGLRKGAMPRSSFIALPVIIGLGLSAWSTVCSAAWPVDPTQNVQLTTHPSSQQIRGMVSDGANGAIVIWGDDRAYVPPGPFNLDLYARRILSDGTPAWAQDGVALCTASGYQSDPSCASDGLGGAILTWTDQRRAGHTDLYVGRVTNSGMTPWSANGVLVCNDCGPYTGIAPDGTGGAIVAWGGGGGAYARRFNSSGTAQWAGAVQLSANSSGKPAVIPDGSGGAIISWTELGPSVWAQRLNSAGAPQWGGGVQVTSVTGSYNPEIISDGSGGAIIAMQSDSDIRAQRLNGSGVRQWDAGGVALCAAANTQESHKLVSDGAGGAIVVWQDARDLGNDDIYARRVSAAGVPQWTADGVPVCVAASVQALPQIVSDGAGGAIVGWEDQRQVQRDIYAQRIGPDGSRRWRSSGVAVCTDPSDQYLPYSVPAAGGAILAWFDTRGATAVDVYAQFANASGGLGDSIPPPPPVILPADDHAVSFSVNGPVDPHTEGIRDPRGAPPTPQVPVQAGNGLALGIRNGPVPQAAGLVTPRPGDVLDHIGPPAVPSEAAVFQSAPILGAGPPDGTNNQIVAPAGTGLVAGVGGAPGSWTSLDDGTYPCLRDNIDALSFGEDYFPEGITVGLDPASGLPDPPPGVRSDPWANRGALLYKEPAVLADGGGIVLRFSVDPWAIGAPGTAVGLESGGADVGGGLGPWTSPGGAASDIFRTTWLRKPGGGTGNQLVRDHFELALAPDPGPLDPMEDDLDALECVGQSAHWVTGAVLPTGSIHDRVIEVGADLPVPGASIHDPRHETPVFFSVTRNSSGEALSAVRSQFVNDGGAAADIFVMAKDPADGAGDGTNLLFIDEAELGLLAVDASPDATGPADYTDDLDALILHVCPEFRETVVIWIDYIMANRGVPDSSWTEDPVTGARTGVGMTTSIMRYLAALIPPGCIQAGFSVTTDAVGLVYTGVDWEAGPVAPAGGVASAAGDLFYAQVTGAVANRNYLWYEEVDLGLDPGSWINGASGDLGDLCDNINGLDSGDSTTTTTVGVLDPVPLPTGKGIELAPGQPNPSFGRTALRFRTDHAGRVRLMVHDVSGRVVASLLDEERPAGSHVIWWDGRRANGQPLPAGVYLVRASLDGVPRSRKIVLQR